MSDVVWGVGFALVLGSIVIAGVLWSYFTDPSARDDDLVRVPGRR